MMVKLRRLIHIFFSLIIVTCCAISTAHAAKIVGLVQVRNEALVIEQTLRALAFYTDAIVVLDDASEDTTVAIIESLAQELSIASILKNKRSAWQVSTENENRQKLLDAGRLAGGTHFILIDADEVFSANCMHNNYLRKRILALKPGMILRMPCVNVWNGLTYYRDDAWCSPHQKRWSKRIAFCDDGVCSYIDNKSRSGGPAHIIHALRTPENLCYGATQPAKEVITYNTCYVLLHFKYASLDSILIKKNWYMCLEFIRAQEKNNNALFNATRINEVYDKKEFECLVPKQAQMRLKEIMPSWLAYNTIDFSSFSLLNIHYKNEINRWFNLYGEHRFDVLNLNKSVL